LLRFVDVVVCLICQVLLKASMRELMVRLEDMGEHSLVQDAKASLKQLFNDLKNKYVPPHTHTQIDRRRERERREVEKEEQTHEVLFTLYRTVAHPVVVWYTWCLPPGVF
jgi:hypothetical protein